MTRFIIDRALNHTDATVGGIYDRFTYTFERMDAVTKLGAHIALQTHDFAYQLWVDQERGRMYLLDGRPPRTTARPRQQPQRGTALRYLR